MRKISILEGHLRALKTLVCFKIVQWTQPRAACAVLLILIGIAPQVHANTVLNLDASHFKLEVNMVSGGTAPTYKARLTFMNTNMNNVASMSGVMKLRTNVLASQVTTLAFISTLENVYTKVSPSADDSYTTGLIFFVSSDQGWNSNEIVFEWVFGSETGIAITEAAAMLDGIVAVEIIEGCKVLPPAYAIGLNEVVPDETATSVEPEPQAPRFGGEAIHVFPSPARDRLWLQVAAAPDSPDRIRICNSTGQVVMEANLDTPLNGLDIQHLASGTYYLHGLRQGVRVCQQRFCKF